MKYKKQNIIAVAVIITLALALVATYTYDRSPQDILERLIYKLDLVDAKPVHTYLPDYYYDQVTFPLPHSYHNITTPEEFEMWQNKPGGIRHAWSDRPTLQEVPIKDIVAEAVSVSEKQGYTLTKFTMESFFDPGVIIFYEILPHHYKDASLKNDKYDAVLIIPGSGHTGALDVLGEDGPWRHKYYHNSIAQSIAHAGYATYVIELRGYGERAIDTGYGWCKDDDQWCSAVLAAQKMQTFGISMNDLRTDEITQVLAWIQLRSYTDDVIVGGLSLGGSLALDQAIVNGNAIKGVFIASGISSTIHSPLSSGGGGRDMTGCCDISDHAASIAPLPAYVSYGVKDIETIWEIETGHTANIMAGAYDLHSASEDFWYVVHDGGHSYDTKSLLNFLNTYLQSIY